MDIINGDSIYRSYHKALDAIEEVSHDELMDAWTNVLLAAQMEADPKRRRVLSIAAKSLAASALNSAWQIESRARTNAEIAETLADSDAYAGLGAWSLMDVPLKDK